PLGHRIRVLPTPDALELSELEAQVKAEKATLDEYRDRIKQAKAKGSDRLLMAGSVSVLIDAPLPIRRMHEALCPESAVVPERIVVRAKDAAALATRCDALKRLVARECRHPRLEETLIAWAATHEANSSEGASAGLVFTNLAEAT